METQEKTKWEIDREARQLKSEQETAHAIKVFTEVGKILGYTVQAGNCDWYIRLINPDGITLSVSGFISEQYRYNGKYSISGNYSYNARDCGAIGYNDSLPEIGVNINKTPEQIAKDIQRRLLPLHLEIEAKCRAYKAKKEHRLLTRDTALSDLAEYAGTVFNRCTWKDSTAIEDFSLPAIAGKIESYDGESFTMVLNALTSNQVKAIINLLK